MAASTFVSVGDYLRHTYYPDRDFVEGALLERNVGEIDHGDAARPGRVFDSGKLPPVLGCDLGSGANSPRSFSRT